MVCDCVDILVVSLYCLFHLCFGLTYLFVVPHRRQMWRHPLAWDVPQAGLSHLGSRQPTFIGFRVICSVKTDRNLTTTPKGKKRRKTLRKLFSLGVRAKLWVRSYSDPSSLLVWSWAPKWSHVPKMPPGAGLSGLLHVGATIVYTSRSVRAILAQGPC